MWITNGGFSDRVKCSQKSMRAFTAFIVERDSMGSAPEQRAQDGTPWLVNDAVGLQTHSFGGNLLEKSQGSQVAFNVLNFGRYKLGAACVGGACQA